MRAGGYDSQRMDYVIAALVIVTTGWLFNSQMRIRHQLRTIIEKEHRIVATLQDFTEGIARIDAKVDAGNASLSNIEADIADLKSQIASGGMSADAEAEALAQVASLEARVAAQADRLAAIDNATPGTPPAEPPVE